MHVYDRMLHCSCVANATATIDTGQHNVFEYVHNHLEKLKQIPAWTKQSLNIASIVATPSQHSVQDRKHWEIVPPVLIAPAAGL